jgi:predicted ester cyclase
LTQVSNTLSGKIAMSAEENKTIFLRFIRELNQGNLAIIGEVCSANFVFYSPRMPNWPRGFEGARKLIRDALAVVPDMQSSIEDIFAEGDKVAVRWTFRGTYRGERGRAIPNQGSVLPSTRSVYTDLRQAKLRKTGAWKPSDQPTSRGDDALLPTTYQSSCEQY